MLELIAPYIFASIAAVFSTVIVVRLQGEKIKAQGNEIEELKDKRSKDLEYVYKLSERINDIEKDQIRADKTKEIEELKKDHQQLRKDRQTDHDAIIEIRQDVKTILTKLGSSSRVNENPPKYGK